MIRSHVALALLLPLLLAPAKQALAIEASPFVGVMLPANSLLLAGDGASYLRMQTHTVYGLGLGTSLTQRIGAEVVLGAGTGKLELQGSGTTFSFPTTMFFADLRARTRLLGGERSSLGIVLGVGYTDFKLGLFDLANETDQGDFIGRLTGVAGVDVRTQLSERLHLKVVIVDRLHKQGAGLNLGTDFSEKTQNDIFATAGLAFALGD
jgi:hypothetical protein